MTKNEGVVKLGGAAAVATNDNGHHVAKEHAGPGAEVHRNAEVWRVFRHPGDNDYVICPNGDGGSHDWSAEDDESSIWKGGPVKPQCIIITPRDVPPTRPTVAAGSGAKDSVGATVYLRQSAGHGPFDDFVALRKHLDGREWTEDKPRWIVRGPDGKWIAIEHS